jgi:prepilin-type N-terminal cleavage/methylation domain-containing protein/prepilin-type processing-associated H-X9-DG protein
MSSRPRQKRGFTLIELLVVVAIIALLISILVPSLARAKRNAKRAVCASNLHQIGLAIPAYAQDNGDWCLDAVWQYVDENGIIQDYNLVWLWGGEKGKDWPNLPAHRRLMYPYVYPEFFLCPEDRMQRDYWPSDPNSDYQTIHEATGTSYPLNGYNWDGFANMERSFGRLGIIGRKFTHITNLKCVFTGDAVMDEYFGDCDPPPWGPNPGAGLRWHDDNEPWANLLFVDGSVRYVLITPTDRLHRPPRCYWWENDHFSFCPTARAYRDEDPWYRPGQ